MSEGNMKGEHGEDLGSVDNRSQYRIQKDTMRQKNRNVRSPIGRLGKEVIPRKTGRPKKYTPTKMRNGINKYFEWCEENDEMPTLKGMMVFLKMVKSQFYQYVNYPEFNDIMEQAKLIISDWCEKDVYETPGQCAGKVAYMKNIHGWSEKIQTDNKTEVVQIENPQQATRKIEQLMPELLEILGDEQALADVIEEYGDAVDAEYVESDQGEATEG